MIIFGGKASKIGRFTAPPSTCAHCENQHAHEISVLGKYFHLYWIPMFPTGRKAVAECKDCKKTIDLNEFPLRMKNLYELNKLHFKRPSWHWLGLIVIGFFIAHFIVVYVILAVANANL